MYPTDSFQDHLTWFLYCLPNWLLSTPFNPILSLCTLLTPFKTIWPSFIIVYPIDSFQDDLTQIYHYIPNWLLSRPFEPIWLVCTQLTPFKTILPDFIIVCPLDSFQDHITWILYCVPKWLLSRLLNDEVKLYILSSLYLQLIDTQGSKYMMMMCIVQVLNQEWIWFIYRCYNSCNTQ